jgi:hypothetical protein
MRVGQEGAGARKQGERGRRGGGGICGLRSFRT